jgi:DNA-binding response OmpR family regulator
VLSQLLPRSPVPPLTLPTLLFVDDDSIARRFVPVLSQQFQVTTASDSEIARHILERAAPAFVVMEIDLPDGGGTDVCRTAKSLQVPSTVLVTTGDVQRAPDAIAAGCDAVLLKPFAPNLLFGRVGRLLRARSAELRARGMRQRAKSEHLAERTDMLAAGTNRHWPNAYCPYCNKQGVTSFEFTSYRRAWYACLDCRTVWLAKRQE